MGDCEGKFKSAAAMVLKGVTFSSSAKRGSTVVPVGKRRKRPVGRRGK